MTLKMSTYKTNHKTTPDNSIKISNLNFLFIIQISILFKTLTRKEI